MAIQDPVSGYAQADDKSGHGPETEMDSSQSAVNALVSDIFAEQGGTVPDSVDGSKGNSDPFDFDLDERVHSDGQGYRWHETPREE